MIKVAVFENESHLIDATFDTTNYYYFDNMSMAEIAEKMGFANADTAKTKKYKCKQELDKKIKTLYKAGDFMD